MSHPGWLIEFERRLYEKNAFTDCIAQIEHKLGIPRLYVVIGSGVGLALALLLGNVGLLICNVLGFVYPTYASVKAIESREDPDDETKWLTYWVVFSLFAFFEFFAATLLSLIPFYAVLKCLMLFWLMAPGPNNGSLIVYRQLIRPIVFRVNEDGARAILPPVATHMANE